LSTLKKAISILLAVLIISQMMVNVGVGIYYRLNKVYITNQLCVNKGNPSLHCDGRCYLSKQLKKAEQGEKQSAQSFKEKDEIISNTISDNPFPYFPSLKQISFLSYIKWQPCAENLDSLIKPPAGC